MTAIFVAAALVLSAAVPFLGIALARARRLKLRNQAVLAAQVPAIDAGLERLVDAPRALCHGTRFADGAPLVAPAYREPCVCDLVCTAQALCWTREGGGATLSIPLAWIEDASLTRAFALLAGKDLPMLRLSWRRGGELLVTDFSLRGGLAQLEKLRREIHLRQGGGGALAALSKFIEAAESARSPVTESGTPTGAGTGAP